MKVQNDVRTGIPRTVIAVLACAVCIYAEPTWLEHTIDTYASGTASIYVADLDNDGDKDAMGAILETNSMVWWRNDGGSPIHWTKFVIDANFSQAISVYAADLDNDGDQDVIGAASNRDEIAWWENEGGSPVQWAKHVIRSNYDFAHEVYAFDLDVDGDTDVLGASSFNDLISWWRNDGGTPIQWTEQTIGSSFDGAKSVRVADFDDDGDYDVVGACLYGNEITWWRNDGGVPIQWTEFTIDAYFAGAHRVQAIDIDDDQDVDILAVAYFGHEIAWYRNDGGDPVAWTKQTITTGFVNACIAQAADLDGDGDLDVAGSAQTSDEVAWWRNDGGSPIVWTKFYIEEYFERVWPLYVCDLDDDSDEDVLAGSSWAGILEVRWWENAPTGIQEQATPHEPRRVIPASIVSGPLPRFMEENYTIFNSAGQHIESRNPAPGVYFLHVNGAPVYKLVKVK